MDAASCTWIPIAVLHEFRQSVTASYSLHPGVKELGKNRPDIDRCRNQVSRRHTQQTDEPLPANKRNLVIVSTRACIVALLSYSQTNLDLILFLTG